MPQRNNWPILNSGAIPQQNNWKLINRGGIPQQNKWQLLRMERTIKGAIMAQKKGDHNNPPRKLAKRSGQIEHIMLKHHLVK